MNTASCSSSLQIWDNATFVEDSFAGPGPGMPGSHSHLPLQPISLNIADEPIKENRSPRSKKPAGDIDAEIAQIESEISRLSKKLETLKIKKAQASSVAGPAKTPAQKRGRVVPAKFLNLETPPPPPPLAASSKKIPIQESRRRGLSLGPMEIYKNATPLRVQKPSAGFPKLEGIKEKGKESTVSARRRGMSLGPSEILRQRSSSPKARKPMNSRVSELRKGVSTVGAKKPSAKMDGASASASGVKPKTLFQEKKRPDAKVRVVASRYNEVGSKRRKWSLPEAERSGAKGKKRAFSLGGANAARLKAEAEAEEERSPPPSIMKIAKGLPKIRTSRVGAMESPRDSGAAKRVAELVGRRSCFAAADDDGGSGSPSQSLSFEE